MLIQQPVAKVTLKVANPGMMLGFRRSRGSRGVAILSLVMSLAIIGILSGMYLGGGTLGPGAPGAKPWPQQQTDRARSAVCDANRNVAMQKVVIMQIDSNKGFLSPDELQLLAPTLPRCPGTGKFYVFDNRIFCTEHTPPIKFRETFVK
ncbi:MAG: type II secretion system protein [Sumerlaeia bacterium]